MSVPQTERNLLAGVLALQMDFVGRDQLITAMNAWVLEKQSRLEDILLRHAAIDEDIQRLLTALVQKHLEYHQHDAQRSLASLSSVGLLELQLRSLGDTDVNASLASMGTHRDSDQFAPTIQPDAEEASSKRFRVLRLHAKGGLGEVWVARDGEIGREVALKQIQIEHAYNAQRRARFVLEAVITGSLEHPGIVPVYGVGHYADGRPFYAMRLIRGDNLQDAIRRFHEEPHQGESDRRLALRKLLGRFVDVCNAIAYAHSRGVLHRDLKPGNIMLGKYGETLVVDWGLAKQMDQEETQVPVDQEPLVNSTAVSGSQSAPTEMGQVLGTPAYMSPEQAAGRLDLLGPSSDVYSLGATLYTLLTGKAPFESQDGMLKEVQQGRFRAPRVVKPDVPRPLEAICLKAMALSPSDRYSAPDTLADDVERWMADEPVAVYRESLVESSRRWMRKHQTFVTSTVVTLTIVAIGLLGGAVLLNHARDRERLAKADAQEQRRIAQENFEQALHAVDEYFTNVSQEYLLNEPGMERLRERLLASATTYYEDFVQKHDESTPLRAELANAFRRLAMIRRKLGSPQALEIFDKARVILDQLHREQPDDFVLQQKLASTLTNMGDVYFDAGKLDQAFTSYDQARQLFEQCLDQPEANVSLYELSTLYRALGGLASRKGNFPEAGSWNRRALEMSERLVGMDPLNANYQDSLADNLAALGNAEYAMDPSNFYGPAGSASSREYLTRAIEIRERLVELDPRSLDFRKSLAQMLLEFGLFQRRGMRLKPESVTDVLQSLQRSMDVFEELVRRSPSVVSYQMGLAEACDQLAYTLQQSADNPTVPDALARALPLIRRAYEIVKKLADADPQQTAYQEAIVNYLNMIGLIQRDNQQPDEAESTFAEAVTRAEQLVKSHPDAFKFRDGLVMTYHNLGRMHEIYEHWDKALTAYDKSRETLETLVQHDATVLHFRDMLATAHQNVAMCQANLEQGAAASQSFKKSIEIREQLAKERSEAIDILNICEGYSMLGQTQQRNDEFNDALQSFETALERVTPFVKQPQYAEIANQLAVVIRTGRITAYSCLGQHEKALSELEELKATAANSEQNTLGLLRATTLAWLGKHAQATTEAEQLLERIAPGDSGTPDPGRGELLYLAVRVFSVASTSAANDNELPPADRQQLSSQYAARAMELLKDALDNEYFKDGKNLSRLDSKDPALTGLRNHPEFARFREQARLNTANPEK